MTSEGFSQVTLLYYVHQTPHTSCGHHQSSMMVGVKDLWPCEKKNKKKPHNWKTQFICYLLRVLAPDHSLATVAKQPPRWWKEQLGSLTWFMFGIFKRARRQMDAPLVVCYCVRENPFPRFETPAASQSSLLSHDRGQGEVRKCRRLVWLIWLRKERQRPAVCTLGMETDRASR